MVKLPYFTPESEILEISLECSILSEKTNLERGREIDYEEL